MNADGLKDLDRMQIQSGAAALESVNRMALPTAVEILAESFSGLGPKIHRDACRRLDDLKNKYGDKLPYLIGLSARETWFALYDGAGTIALMIAEGVLADSDQSRYLATAEGYGEDEGVACALYNHLAGSPASHQQTTIQDYTPFEGRPSWYDILEGAALYWFAEAAGSYRAGNVEGAFNWISEAYDALSLSLLDKGSSEMVKDAHSYLASRGAKQMLAKSPKQKDKATVRECWETWQKRPDSYDSKAAFARDMREKFSNLESQPVIEGWCRKWEHESKPSVS